MCIAGYFLKFSFKGLSRIVIVSTSVHSVRWGGGGGGSTVKGCRAFLKCRLWCIVILRRGLKVDIFKVLFWKGGGHKKEYPVYALDNVDNSGRPLIYYRFSNK